MFYYLSSIISSAVAFFYPGYACYKTLSQRPANEAEIERWLMYWSVLGCLVGVEYIAEWLISWIPFYYLIKTLILLYLALPQTQGSSYLYIYHLQPFFHNHEAQIDATLASLKARAFTFIQEKARMVWEQMLGHQMAPAAAAAPPPSLNNPVEGPAYLVSSLWANFGPSVMASGAALLKTATTAAAPGGGAAPPSYARTESHSTLDRRRQLEAELAALAAGENSVPMPTGSPSLSPSASSANVDYQMRDRASSNAGSSNGQFEEIPYDVGQEDNGAGHAYAQQQKKGWFGNWATTPQQGAYDRLKDE